MKKIFLATISAAIAFAFTACSQEPKADLKWTTDGGYGSGTITEIYWANGNATWSDLNITTGGQDTASKEVTELTGGGDCLLEGDTATLEIDPDQSEGIEPTTSTNTVMLKEDAQVNLMILSASAAAKK